MTKNKKLEEKQVVRVIEAHTCHGVDLPKGAVGVVYGGETYGIIGENEVPVIFAFLTDLEFLGVEKAKVEAFDGDIATLSARAAGFEKLEFRLRDIQQKWTNQGVGTLAKTMLEMRCHFHVKSLTSLLGWSAEEARTEFLKSETTLKKIGAKPYQVNTDKGKLIVDGL